MTPFLRSLKELDYLTPHQATVTRCWHQGGTLADCARAIGGTTKERARQILARSRQKIAWRTRPLNVAQVANDAVALDLVSDPVDWPVQATWKTVYRPNSETPREPPPSWPEEYP